MNDQKPRLNIKWIILFGAAEFILLVLSFPFIAKLLGMDINTPVHNILKGYEYISIAAFTGWIILNTAFIIYIISVIPKSKLNKWKHHLCSWEELIEKVLKDHGIAFSKKTIFWGWGYSSYEGMYQGLKLKCSRHIGSESSPDFLDIKIFHFESLGLGIGLASRGVEKIDAGEGKDIFSKSVKLADPSFSDIEIHAKKKEEVESILLKQKLTEPLRKLVDIFKQIAKAGVSETTNGTLRKLTGIFKQIGSIKTHLMDLMEKFPSQQSGFYMSDKYISIRLEVSLLKEENIEPIKELMRSAFQLSQAFTANLPMAVHR